MTYKNKKLNILKESILFFGLDSLELYLEDFEYLVDDFGNEHNFNGIDTDNSPVEYISLKSQAFSVIKSYPKGYSHGFQFLIVLEGKSVPLFMIRFPNKGIGKKSLIIYSTYFVVEDRIGIKISDFIEENFLVHSFRGFDIALDTTISIVELQKKYFQHVHFHSHIGKDTKHDLFHQTYYIGDIQSDKNRKSLIRIYDKILDTWKKNKGFLFSHLKNNSEVRRIELEIRPHEAQRLKFDYKYLLSNKNNIIQDLFGQYLNKHWSIQLGNGIDLIPYKFIPYDLKKDYDELGFIPTRYLQSARGYLKKIIENTGFRGLAQTLSGVKYTKDGRVQVLNTYKHLEILEHYIDHLKEIGIHKSLIKKSISKKIK